MDRWLRIKESDMQEIANAVKSKTGATTISGSAIASVINDDLTLASEGGGDMPIYRHSINLWLPDESIQIYFDLFLTTSTPYAYSTRAELFRYLFSLNTTIPCHGRDFTNKRTFFKLVTSSVSNSVTGHFYTESSTSKTQKLSIGEANYYVNDYVVEIA